MATKFSVVVDAGDILIPAISGAQQLSVTRLSKFFNKLAGGNSSALAAGTTLTHRLALVAATGTVTLATAIATNTVTINGVVFTAVASGATANQFNVSGVNATDATALAASINASITALVTGVVTAAAVGPVVTLTAHAAGLGGNAYTLASSGATVAVSGARLTGGAETKFTQVF